MRLTERDTTSRWHSVGLIITSFNRLLVGAHSMGARGIYCSRDAALRWRRPAVGLFLCIAITTSGLVGIGSYHIFLDRANLPDLGPFVRFEFPTIGHIYDTNGQPLVEMATEYRWISKYEDIPPVVTSAILAAEDKNFYSHNGVDYSSIPRVLGKLRIRSLLGRLTKLGRRDAVNSSPIFPQGGSTITQQLVRGYFLQAVTARENSNQLRQSGLLARGLSYPIGAPSVNIVARKVEEIRLALRLEKEMRVLSPYLRRAHVPPGTGDHSRPCSANRDWTKEGRGCPPPANRHQWACARPNYGDIVAGVKSPQNAMLERTKTLYSQVSLDELLTYRRRPGGRCRVAGSTRS
jgi:hypothetical protein